MPSLGDGTNPSRDNLLLHEDEYSELSEEDAEPDWNRRDSWNSHVRTNYIYIAYLVNDICHSLNGEQNSSYSWQNFICIIHCDE